MRELLHYLIFDNNITNYKQYLYYKYKYLNGVDIFVMWVMGKYVQ